MLAFFGLMTSCAKVDCVYMVYGLEWTPIFEWCELGCESKKEHQKDICLERDWTTWLKMVHHLRRNIQHDWGRPI